MNESNAPPAALDRIPSESYTRFDAGRSSYAVCPTCVDAMLATMHMRADEVADSGTLTAAAEICCNFGHELEFHECYELDKDDIRRCDCSCCGAAKRMHRRTLAMISGGRNDLLVIRTVPRVIRIRRIPEGTDDQP